MNLMNYSVFKQSLLKNIILIFSLSFLIGSSTAAEDLLTIYQIAQCNDPTLIAARETLFAAIEAKPQARAAFLPNVSATSAQTINHTSLPNTGDFSSNTFALTITQPVFYYQHWVEYSKANVQVKQAEANYAAAEQDLILRTIKAYFNVLKARDILFFTQAQVKAFGKFYEQTHERYKAGLIATADVEIAKARQDNAVAQEIAANTDLENQREKLKEILGCSFGCLQPLRDEITLVTPNPEGIEKWVNLALHQNFALEAARYAVNVARSNISIQKAGHMPSINIVGSVGHTSSGAISNDPDAVDSIIPGLPKQTTSGVGVQITMPFFSGGSVNSKTRQAKHEYEKSCALFENTYRNTESITRQAFRGALTQISQIAALKQAVKSNRSALSAIEAAFNVGTRTIVDVLNSHSDYIKAKQDYANARYDYITQSITLKFAAGTLSPEDVHHINSWLCNF